MENIPKYNDWMSNLPEWLTKVPISCLAIPGSHDSATHDLDPSLGIAEDQSASIKRLGNTCCVKNIVYKWSKTQTLSVAEQLEAGIRYFDFRIAAHPDTGEVRFVHGLYGGVVVDVLQDINTFLNVNTREIVILDFNHFYNIPESVHKMMLGDINTIFGSKLMPPPFSGPNYKMWGTTLQEIWRSSYRVIVIYHDNSISTFPEIWSKNYIDSPWADTNNRVTLVRYLETNYKTKDRFANDGFYSWQGVLTPRSADILLHPGSSLDSRLANAATEAFVTWVKNKRPGPRGINICNVDFVETHSYIPTVIGLNQNIREIPPPF